MRIIDDITTIVKEFAELQFGYSKRAWCVSAGSGEVPIQERDSLLNVCSRGTREDGKEVRNAHYKQTAASRVATLHTQDSVRLATLPIL